MTGMQMGNFLLGFQCELAGDENNNNDMYFLNLQVESSENPVVINEIMFNPVSGQTEWIELYNKGNSQVDLNHWQFADMRDTILIAQDSHIIAAGEFLILSGDSSVILNYHISPTALISNGGFPTLNNDNDDLKLLSFSGRLIDRVHYYDVWMRRDVEKGVSLERIHPEISSSLADNWAAAAHPNGATPAAINSIYVKKPTQVALLKVQPNPFSPDGDGFEDFTIFEYRLPFATGFLSIDIFDIKGRKIKQLLNKQKYFLEMYLLLSMHLKKLQLYTQ
jgi:hypothetical protein